MSSLLLLIFYNGGKCFVNSFLKIIDFVLIIKVCSYYNPLKQMNNQNKLLDQSLEFLHENNQFIPKNGCLIEIIDKLGSKKRTQNTIKILINSEKAFFAQIMINVLTVVESIVKDPFNFGFKTQTENEIDLKTTVKDFMRERGITNIIKLEGIKFSLVKRQFFLKPNDQFILEPFFKKLQQPFQEICFIELKSQKPFYLTMPVSTNIGKIKEKLKQIAVKQGVMAEIYQIVLFYLQKSNTSKIIDESKATKIENPNYQSLVNLKICHSYGMKVLKKQFPVQKLSQLPYKFILTIFPGKKINLNYDKLRQYKIITILELYGVQNPDQHGVIILNEVFKPGQCLKEVEGILNKEMYNFSKYIEVKVVSEKQLFYRRFKHLYPKVTFNQQIDLFSKLFGSKVSQDVGQKSLKMQKCTIQSEIFPSEELKQSNIKIKKFESPSLIKVKSSDGLHKLNRFDKKESFNHSMMNKYLKDQKFAIYNDKSHGHSGQLNYKKAFQLLSSIIDQKITNEVCYKCVSFLQTFNKKNENILEFKQFNIVYTSQEEALERCNQAKVIFKIISKTARKCGSYIVFLPYTQFQLLDIRKKGKLTEVTLQQVMEQKLPKNNMNFLLWVDDKTAEGQKIFDKHVQDKQKYFLFQLKSTCELKQWLLHYDNILTSEGVSKVVLITNMRRIENGKEVKDAGINSMKLFKEAVPNGEVMFFIGHIEGTYQTLENNGYGKSKLAKLKVHITNHPNQLLKFIEKKESYSIESSVISTKKKSKITFQKQDWMIFFSKINSALGE